MNRVTQGKVSVLAVVIDTDIFLHRDASRNGGGVHFKQQGPRASLLGSLPRFLVQSPPTHPQEIRKGAALCHRHSDLFDEAGQVYVPFGETSTLVGAQGDVDLVVHVKPLGMVVQLFSLQGHSRHEAKSLIK